MNEFMGNCFKIIDETLNLTKLKKEWNKWNNICYRMIKKNIKNKSIKEYFNKKVLKQYLLMK